MGVFGIGLIVLLLLDVNIIVLFRESITDCFHSNNIKLPKTKNLFSWLMLKCDIQQLKKYNKECRIVHKFYVWYVVVGLLIYPLAVLFYFTLSSNTFDVVLIAFIAFKFISLCLIVVFLFPNGARSLSIFNKRNKSK